MLTKDDLKEELKPIKADIKGLKINVKGLTGDVKGIKADIKTLKADVTKIRKDTGVIVDFFDREYLDLRKRVTRIEEHLGLSPI